MSEEKFTPVMIGPGPADSAHVHIALGNGVFALGSPDSETVEAMQVLAKKVLALPKEEFARLVDSQEAQQHVESMKIRPLVLPARFKARGRGTNMTPKKKKRK